ncbi:MAG: hypothetical protein ACLFRR_11510 [Spirochaetaceae bacterium]
MSLVDGPVAYWITVNTRVPDRFPMARNRKLYENMEWDACLNSGGITTGITGATA